MGYCSVRKKEMKRPLDDGIVEIKKGINYHREDNDKIK